MKSIPLYGKWGVGKVTLVDEDIAVLLAGKRIHVTKFGYARLGNHQPLHIYVNKTPKGYHTDHINGNKLDNRRGNLRTATSSQNGHNRHVLNKNNKSGFTGIHFDINRSKWMAFIKINRKRINLGRYSRFEDALIARKEAEDLIKKRELCNN
jgi:hypothetical protein